MKGVRRTLYTFITAIDKRYGVMVESRCQKSNQIDHGKLLCVILEKNRDMFQSVRYMKIIIYTDH
jgi:hypothetical protein